jgi:hypothetical protein
MNKTALCLAMALAAGTSSAAVAHSREWYVSNLPEAKATYERCLARVKGGEALAQADKEECQRASTAVVHAATFTPSKPISY